MKQDMRPSVIIILRYMQDAFLICSCAYVYQARLRISNIYESLFNAALQLAVLDQKDCRVQTFIQNRDFYQHICLNANVANKVSATNLATQ